MAAMAMSNPTAEQAAEWVRRSAADQGVPDRVTDAGVIESVSVLLRDGRVPVRLQPPGGGEPVGVEGVTARGCGVDDHVIQDGADDGVLAG